MVEYEVYIEAETMEYQPNEGQRTGGVTMKEKYLDRLGLSKSVMIALRIVKSLTALCVIGFLIACGLPWYEISGEAAKIGYEAFDAGTSIDEEGKFSLSPYKTGLMIKMNDNSNPQETDVQVVKPKNYRVMLHQIVILLQVLAWVLAALSVMALFATKYLEWIVMIKAGALVTMAVMALNLIFMKMGNLNMWVLKAKDVIHEENPLNGINLTVDGIAMNDVMYPYIFEWTTYFKIGWAFIITWFVLASILTEIRRKWYYDRQDME